MYYKQKMYDSYRPYQHFLAVKFTTRSSRIGEKRRASDDMTQSAEWIPSALAGTRPNETTYTHQGACKTYTPAIVCCSDSLRECSYINLYPRRLGHILQLHHRLIYNDYHNGIGQKMDRYGAQVYVSLLPLL
jgi:hypothetical protein